MSIPVAIWGAVPAVAREVIKLLSPTYDVVHVCTSPSAALEEFPALFSGDKAVRPSSGIGSNASLAEGQDNVMPKAFGFGGGITPEKKQELFEAMKKKANGASWADEIVYVEVKREDVVAITGGGPPPPHVVAKLMGEALKGAGFGD